VALSSVLSVYYDKICLKFASHHFLLYALQKSLNFIYAFKCYRQKNVSWPHFSWPILYSVTFICNWFLTYIPLFCVDVLWPRSFKQSRLLIYDDNCNRYYQIFIQWLVHCRYTLWFGIGLNLFQNVPRMTYRFHFFTVTCPNPSPEFAFVAR